MQGKENGHSRGGFAKYALEDGNKPETDIFLNRLNMRSPIIRRNDPIPNGVRIWTGAQLPVGSLDEESIAKAKGSGYLEIFEGRNSKIIFMVEGNIVGKRVNSREMDPSQARMDI